MNKPISMRHRTLPEQLRYLSAQLQGGTDPTAIWLTLEAMADEQEKETITEPAIIKLPGLVGVHIDPQHRVIAIDGLSGEGEIGTEWRVIDLRDGTYGDFHRLGPAEQCFDPANCAVAGQHITS